MDIFFALKTNKTYSLQLKIVLMILEKYNPRASEVLKALWINYKPKHFLILKGLKRSADIIVRDSEILNMITHLNTQHSPFLFPGITYQHLYHVVKSNYSHLFLKFKTKKNYKVTHGFRFLNANLSNDPQSVKAILSHNSQESGHFYNPNLPKSRN